MPVFEYNSTSEYSDKSFSDEWRVDETEEGEFTGVIANTLEPGPISRFRTVKVDRSAVEQAFERVNEMEEDRDDLYIDESNDAQASGKYFDGFNTNSASPVVRPTQSSTTVQGMSSNNTDISLIFYNRNKLSEDGWIKDPVTNSKGEWEHRTQGRLSSSYAEIVGEPERYEFLVPKNLEYDPKNLPLAALDMLSQLAGNSEDYEDQMSEIIDEDSISGLEWVSKPNKDSNQGLINEIAGDEQVIGVQGAIIPDSLESRWKRGVQK